MMKPQQSVSPQDALGMPGATSLVQGYRISSPLNAGNVHLDVPFCPNAGWLKGICLEHGTERWQSHPCKRRDCPVCGPKRREMVAWRVALSIQIMEKCIDRFGKAEQGAGWFVGGFPYGLSKREQNRRSNQFVKWLKRYLLREFGLVVAWVKTWETYRSGQLHLNLVICPWRFIPQSLLSRKWAQLVGFGVVWIKRVAVGVGKEVAKARSWFGKYVSKFDQQVKTGRGVSYSANCPKLPNDPATPRRGEIEWRWIGSFSEEARMHWYETELGHWKQVAAFEWAKDEIEQCDCFEFGRNLRRIANNKIAEVRLWMQAREREKLSRVLGQNETVIADHLHTLGGEVSFEADDG